MTHTVSVMSAPEFIEVIKHKIDDLSSTITKSSVPNPIAKRVRAEIATLESAVLSLSCSTRNLDEDELLSAYTAISNDTKRKLDFVHHNLIDVEGVREIAEGSTDGYNFILWNFSRMSPELV